MKYLLFGNIGVPVISRASPVSSHSELSIFLPFLPPTPPPPPWFLSLSAITCQRKTKEYLLHLSDSGALSSSFDQVSSSLFHYV